MPPTITMSSDAYTQMSNELNQMGRQYREQMIINKQLIKENEKLKEGHDLIYKSLREAEGGKEFMTSPEPESIADSVKDYVNGFNDMESDRDSMLEVCGDLDNMEECVGYVNELKEEIEKLKEEIEPKELYADEDDWVWMYGNKQKETEYAIHISGGGCPNCPNGFEDWVIKKDADGELRYYIRHGLPSSDKLQGGMKLVSCPDGLYISFQDEGYELREGEQDDWSWLEDELETFETEEEE